MTHSDCFKLDGYLLTQVIIVFKLLRESLLNIGLIEELSNVLTKNLSSFCFIFLLQKQ